MMYRDLTLNRAFRVLALAALLVLGAVVPTAGNVPAVRPYGALPGVVPDSPHADIILPLKRTLAFGTIQIKAAGSRTAVVQGAAFYYQMPGQQPVLIGTDGDGTDTSLDCAGGSTPQTGDGWSAYWDTTRVPDGPYLLIAQLFTNNGPLTASIQVFVEQLPPIPIITTPHFDDFVSGSVPIHADQGFGDRAKFDVMPAATIVKFSAEPFKQGDYPYDGNGGRSMCDPSSEASIYWNLDSVQDTLKNDPKCKNKVGQEQIKCMKELLVKALAQAKKTSKTGTTDGEEAEGAKAVLKALGLTEANGYGFIPINGQNGVPLNYATIKRHTTSANAKIEVKGIVVHAHPKGKNSPRHSMALTSLDDKLNANGKHNICFMDPETGTEICDEMNADGEFMYPPPPDPNRTTWVIDSMSKVTGPKASNRFRPQPLSNGWITIAVKTVRDPDGWNAVWDTTGFAPGLYWVRVTVTDAFHNTGSDQVEVNLVGGRAQPAHSRARPTNSRPKSPIATSSSRDSRLAPAGSS